MIEHFLSSDRRNGKVGWILSYDYTQLRNPLKCIPPDAVAMFNSNPFGAPDCGGRKLLHHLQHTVCFGVTDDVKRKLGWSHQCKLQNFPQLLVSEIRTAAPPGTIDVVHALQRILFD